MTAGILVAGAGIAGLTAALALARKGVSIDIIEAAERLSEAGAGLQLSPNATRVLRELGVLDATAARGTHPEVLNVRAGHTGRALVTLPFGASAEQRYGAPFLVVHRADLQAVLVEAVQARPGIRLHLGQRIAAATATDRTVEVRTADGSPFSADALVGADGLHSTLRRTVAPALPDPLRFSGRIAWRTLVPAEAAPALARSPASNLWLGPDAHLVHYPVRAGASVNVVATVKGSLRDLDQPDRWGEPGDAARLLPAFARWAAEPLALLRAAPQWRVWPLYERDRLPQWSRGAIVLIGDAAHPMLPFLAQGAAQAIEDAWAYAEAWSSAKTPAEAATRFEAARRAKAERVQAQSARMGQVYHLPPPASLARDMTFRLLGGNRMARRYDWLYGA